MCIISNTKEEDKSVGVFIQVCIKTSEIGKIDERRENGVWVRCGCD